ncbi:MAG: DUF5685 family protein [Bacillota bacterium]|nr:DUF5685 family protein [Bacillota bacterium]
MRVFGYVRPDRAELKVREYQVFRAHYCGLCAALARLGGTTARFTVSYEGAFLGLLLSSLRPDAVTYRRGRCPLPPWRQVPLAVAPCEQRYAAAVNVLLAYHRLGDDVRDSGAGHMRWLGAAGGRLLLGSAARRAAGLFPHQAGVVEQCLADLQAREREGCADLDRAADPFARLLAEVAAGPGDWDPRPGDAGAGGRIREGLRHLGYNLGKWVYTADAMADLEADLAAGRYNPVVAVCGGRPASDPGARGGGALRERARARVDFLLTQCLARVAEVVELLPLESNRGLIENVVYLGLRDQTEKVLAGPGGGERCDRSVRGAGFETRCQRSGDQAGVPGAGQEVPSRPVPG